MHLSMSPLSVYRSHVLNRVQPEYVTLYISGGRKDKVRRGDILGAITKQIGLEGKHVGKIDVVDHSSYVAIERGYEAEVVKRLKPK